MRYVSLTAILLTSACAVGPDYHRPSIDMPDYFKEGVLTPPAPDTTIDLPAPVAAETTADTAPVSDTALASDTAPRKVVAEAAQPAPEIVTPTEKTAEKTAEKVPEKTAENPAEKTAVSTEDTSSPRKPYFSTVAFNGSSSHEAAPLPAPAESTDAPVAAETTTDTVVADSKSAPSTDATPAVEQKADTVAADAKPASSTDVPVVAEATTDTVVADAKPVPSADVPAAPEHAKVIPVADATPSADAPEAAKQLHAAQPQEDASRGQWWSVFDDAALNELEEQVASHNQTVQASEAAFHQARALVAEYRSAYFPTVSGDVSMTRSKGSQSSASSVSSAVSNHYNTSLGASWVPDFWGRVRRQMESGNATAEAGAANLAVATLSAQTELATDYLSLRIADEQKRLLQRTTAAYSKALYITENQYKAGVAARSDVLQAKVQLDTAQAQLVDVGVQRAQYEHAIAVLIGKAPAVFSLAEVNTVPTLPETPDIVPSQLMERRPDIASSERTVIAANAQIGVAEAAYFPDITLAASGGYGNSHLADWFLLPSRFWSIGPSLAETLFDGGLRSAQTEAAIATYDQTVANYRQTVLTAFQAVEDNLASLRILADESVVLESAVKDAHASAEVSMNQYKAGTVSYLTVVTTQTASLNAELSALNIRKQRLLAATTLIENVGGGWDVAELSKPSVTQSETTPISIFPPRVED